MGKNLYIAAISFIAVMLFSQCSNREENVDDYYGKEYPQTKKATAIIDSCMSFMETDPARSHEIIDSVCKAKLMSPQRCDYYHAMVVFEGENKRDSALAICDKLLDERQFGDDKFLEEELCVLASNITFSHGRYIETLKYANRGIAICHGQELMNYDEAMLLGRVGQADAMLGRIDEAKRTYADADALLKGDKTFGGLIARISLMKKRTALYSDLGDYDKAIEICQEVLDLVARFHRDPSFIEQRPETMQTSGDATLEFADFYQSQMYSRIARAYRMKIGQGNTQTESGNKGSHDTTANNNSNAASAFRDSINLYLDKWEQTQSHSSPDNLASALHELYYTGRQAEFDSAKTAVADLYKGDSIVKEYVDYLNLLAEDAASRHDLQQSNAYLQRALAVSDSIRQQESLRMLSEQMSINMVQQQQLARQEAEHKASLYQLIIVIIIIVLASALVIYILRRRNKEKDEILQMTQQDLIESQEEVNDIIHQLEESKIDKSAKGMEDLYHRIEQVINEKKLYLNPDFSIIMLADELLTNRTFISTCINTITGKSFRIWLGEYRLNLFIEKQKENPEASIEQLLTECGYKDQSTFRRQFKATYGTTPSKYNPKKNKNK